MTYSVGAIERAPFNHGVSRAQMAGVIDALVEPKLVFIHTGKLNDLTLNFLTGEANAKGNLLAVAFQLTQNKRGGETHFVATINEHQSQAFMREALSGAAIYVGVLRCSKSRGCRYDMTTPPMLSWLNGRRSRGSLMSLKTTNPGLQLQMTWTLPEAPMRKNLEQIL